MKNYQQDGNAINWTNDTGAAVTAGTMVKIGSRVGVCAVDIANSASGAVALSGVFNSIPKITTDVVTVGADLYWDNTNKRLTLTATANTLAGFAYAAAGNGVTTVTVCINK